MAEVAFAKTFLTTLDSRPVKLSADHVEDAKNFPSRPPYIISRMETSMSKPNAPTSLPGSEASINVKLRSLRNPPIDISLSSQSLSTSLLDIKTIVSTRARIPADKIKLLLNKRPVQDSKILKDLISEGDKAVEFAIMVIGGAAAVLPVEEAKDTNTTSLADSESFWEDLKGFLMQRLKDEALAKEMSSLFRSSWESKQSAP